MSEEIVDLTGAVASSGGLRSYPGPWEGQIVLACRKCQKKLKHSGKKDGIAKLSKELKKRGRRNRVALTVIGVSCLNMCPKGGVTVCTQGQLGRGECSIIRTKADVDAVVGQL
jgi:hypothetical protein